MTLPLQFPEIESVPDPERVRMERICAENRREYARKQLALLLLFTLGAMGIVALLRSLL